jgi:hypothetical protein
MLIDFTTGSSYKESSLFNTLLSWQFQFVIILFLVFLLILFCCWTQYIKNSSGNKGGKQKLGNSRQQANKTITDDTIRKIPLQTLPSKRKMLVSKPLKTNNKKSSTLTHSSANQVDSTYFSKSDAEGLRTSICQLDKT